MGLLKAVALSVLALLGVGMIVVSLNTHSDPTSWQDVAEVLHCPFDVARKSCKRACAGEPGSGGGGISTQCGTHPLTSHDRIRALCLSLLLRRRRQTNNR